MLHGQSLDRNQAPVAMPIHTPSIISDGRPLSIAEAMSVAKEHHRAGRMREAESLYRHILETEPKHADALHLLGVIAHQLGEHETAVTLIRRALAARADFARAHNNLGAALKALGRLGEAKESFLKAGQLEPDFADAHYNRGTVLQSLGQLESARAAYLRALEIEPGLVDAHSSLGGVLLALGQSEKALAAFRRCVSIRPDFAQGYFNIANALKVMGRLEDAIRAFQRSIELEHACLEAHYNLGNSYSHLGRYDAAVSAYEQSIAIDPDFAEAHYNLGNALREKRNLNEASRSYLRALELRADFAGARTNLGITRLEQGDPRAALDAFNHNLKQDPHSSGDLAHKAVALHQLGEIQSARELVDLDRFIRAIQLEAPCGFADLEEFNLALADHVSSHPTLRTDPTNHATRLGKHSGELLPNAKGPMLALERMIRGAVEDYVQALRPDIEHPFVTGLPKKWTLTAWAVVLEAQGHQVPHIHPSAWLSGVYYVEVPNVVRTQSKKHPGWLEFGRPDDKVPLRLEPEVKLFEPREGLMLLFPSYFFHRTIPFEAAGRRISIAFDVMRTP